MVLSSGSIFDPYISHVRRVKIQALITDNLIPKIWGKIDSDHIGYNLLQDKGDEYDPIKF